MIINSISGFNWLEFWKIAIPSFIAIVSLAGGFMLAFLNQRMKYKYEFITNKIFEEFLKIDTKLKELYFRTFIEEYEKNKQKKEIVIDVLKNEFKQIHNNWLVPNFIKDKIFDFQEIFIAIIKDLNNDEAKIQRDIIFNKKNQLLHLHDEIGQDMRKYLKIK